jgi:hypothetical protein
MKVYASTDTGAPKFSVAIPTYNPQPIYLQKTLQSILNQNLDFARVRVEVFDDASTEVDVESLVKNISYGEIAYHKNTKNLGFIANWNNCIKQTSGEWIHILHQDDLVLPGFYDKLELGLQDKNTGAAFCRHFHIDENSQYQWLTVLERHPPGFLDNWLDKIAITQRIQFASIVVKRSIFQHLGGFNPKAGSAADWEMWKRIAAHYAIWYEPQPLACYRLHSSSETSRLIQTGANIADTRKAIEISRAYLPRDKANYLSAQALEHYAQYALREAHKQLQLRNREAAQAQIQEALKCSQSPQIQAVANHLLKALPAETPMNSLALTNPSAFLNQVFIQLNAYRQNPQNPQALEALRKLRYELAQACLELPPEQLIDLKNSPLAQAHALLKNSVLKYEYE